MRQGALNIAIKAARAAGTAIVRSLNRLDSVPVVEKQRYDFASEVDRAAEAEAVREIRRAFPDHAILAEEGGASGSDRARFTWVIDPLDGTSNYLRGFPHYAVSIAQLDRGEAVLGVVYDPVRDEMFLAARGSGATLNERKVRIGQRLGLEGALIATGLPYRQRPHLAAQLGMIRALLGEAEDIRRTGSAALDLCYVACGRLDGFFEIGLKPWDVAAGALIVREAGGRVTDFRGEPGFMESGNVVAANLKVGDAMLAAIKPELSAELARQ
jgi:myo-inositol-1(or 4)-monophosphatase